MSPAACRLSEAAGWRMVPARCVRGVGRRPPMLPSYKLSTGWQKDRAKGLEKSGWWGESATQSGGANKAQLGKRGL